MTHSSSPYEINTADQEDYLQEDNQPLANRVYLGDVDDESTSTLSSSWDELTHSPEPHPDPLAETTSGSDGPPSLEPHTQDLHTYETSIASDAEQQFSTINSSDDATTSTQQSTKTNHQSSDQPSAIHFQARVMSWALAMSMLPVLAVGTVTYFSGQSVQQQITQTQQTGEQAQSQTALTIQQQLPTLLIGTGLTAILAGAIAAWLAHRATAPVLKAAQISSQMLDKLHPEADHSEQDPDALVQLERNIQIIETKLPALLGQQDAEIEQLQMLKYITNKIRTSLNTDDILNTTVEETRRLLKTDRVIVYGFDENWYGTVIAESVIPGLPKALWAEIRDPCFAEHYVDKYQAGRVLAINNVYKAGLTDCHLSQLEPFQVKANLVVPILREEQLFGLLIAHQCSQTREWQQVDIDFFSQVASQLGFALDHARLLTQVEQVNLTTVNQSQQALREFEALQQGLLQLSVDSDGVVDLLTTDANLAITNTQNQMHAITAAADQLHLILNEIVQIQQHAQSATYGGQAVMAETVNHLQELNQVVTDVGSIIQPLQQPTQQLGELIDLMGHIVSQVQLQAMNAALEAARTGTVGQAFAEIAEKVHGLTRQLDATLTDIKPLVNHIQTAAQSATAGVATGRNTIATDTQLLSNAQEKLDDLDSLHQRFLELTQQMTTVTTNQVNLSTSNHQTLDHLARTTLDATEKSSQISDVVRDLITSVTLESSHEEESMS